LCYLIENFDLSLILEYTMFVWKQASLFECKACLVNKRKQDMRNDTQQSTEGLDHKSIDSSEDIKTHEEICR
jgi:hypothetical protein